MSQNEFVSELEKIMPAEELDFDPTPGFGVYRRFLSHAVSHPAKANTKLLAFLIKTFTKEVDTVLDPMAGSGSTGVVASIMGRNAVQVELESKFYDWMERARVNVEKGSIAPNRGWIRNICGDARNLSDLLSQEVDGVITSPPFSESLQYRGGTQNTERMMKGNRPAPYSLSNENIGNLRHGSIDAVVTSPPYGDTNDRKGRKMDSTRGIRKRAFDRPKNTENIGNLPLGQVDAVITSPPYEGSSIGGGDQEKRRERLVESGYNPKDFLGGKARNTVLKHYDEVDTVITSPPYEDALGKHHATSKLQKVKRDWGEYSTDRQNIGNLKRGSYLSEMLRVYSEMHKILKPQGLAIIVIKPFIRNKQVVDLPYQTWLLLKKVGFNLEKLYKLRLKNPSFWRILYRNKHPEVAQINHEFVIVAQKAS